MNDLSRPPPPRSLPNNPSSRRTVGQVPSARPAGLPQAQPQQPAAAAVDSKKDVSHVPCKFYRSGGCTAGSSCIFAHVQPEAGQQKQPCQYFQKGSCKFGRKCALAHILPGQPMSMDRKNKKAAEAQAQALTEKVASSLFASSPATLPPIPRVNSNGAASSLNPIPTKPKSPSKPNGLPPNPTTGASSASQEKETSGASSSTKSSWDPAAVAAASSSPSSATTKALPTTTKGFSFASLFPGSSASKLASTTAPSSLPPRPSVASAVPSSSSTAKEAKLSVDTSLNPSPSSTAASSIAPTPAPPATASQPPASAPVASHPPSLPSSSAHSFPAPPPSHPPPPAVSFAFGSAVRPPNGTAFPPVQRKDIVFGTTNRENSTTSPPSSSFSPTNQHLSSFPSPKPYSAIPTPIGPPHTRRTSHGPISPPASASSHSPQSFHPSPQHFHPTPTPLSPTRRLAPPLSSSSSYNAGPGVIGNGGGAGGSPFSTSPFFAGPLGSRGLFLSSSYDNHVLDRTGSFTAGLSGGQPASMVDLDRGFEKWGGRGGSELSGEESGDEYSGRVGSRSVVEEDGQGGSDDGEDFLPSSLNELLTDQEMERRMTRRGSNTGGSSMIAALPSQQQQPQYSSNQFGSGNHSLFAAPHLQQPLPPPIVDDPRAHLDFTPLDRGHNSVPYSSTAMRPNLGMTPAMRLPWDDDEDALGGAGSGRTVGRGRNTLRRPPVPFETNVASNGEAYPTEGDGSFKIGPSHASVAFLPNFGERRYPPAPPPPTDSFGHPPTSSSSNFFPPPTKNPSSLLSSSLLQRPTTPTNHKPNLSNGFPSAFSNTNASSQQQQRWNLPLLSSSSSTANSNSISSFPNPQHQQQHHQPSPQTQIGGFGQQQAPQQQQYLHHAAASSTATLMAPLSPEELAASHEPGMSLPPGLGIGLGRTRIPFGVGVEQQNHHFASTSNQQQQQGYPSSRPWSSSSTTTTGRGRWITSIGAGGGVGLQAEEDVEDEMDDNVLFD